MGRSMTQTYRFVGFVLLVSMLEPTFAVNICSAGRFGKTCILSCNCERSLACGEDGLCPNNEPCKSPYFGPGCQYVDFLITHALANTSGYLRDGNHSSCNPDATARIIHLTLSVAQTMTWIQIHVSNNFTLFHRNFTVKLNMNSRTSATRYRTGDTSMAIVVSLNSKPWTTITIEGPVVSHICTINVSGGRNVARNQNVSQSSNYSGDPLYKVRAENSVDGNNSPDYASGTCSRTEFENPPMIPHWNITLDRKYDVKRVFLYNSNVNTGYLFGFGVNCYNERGHLLIGLVNQAPTPLPVYSVNFYDTLTLTKININGQSSSRSHRVLLMCEVEIFGDPKCPNQAWGLECQYQCHCGNGGGCSFFTGSCEYSPVYYCPPGTHGDLCEMSCPKNCRHNMCDPRSGACLQCNRGFHGELCDQECNAGWFGDNCSEACSITCLDQLCDNITGDCLSCVDTWTGPKCEECKDGWFGENCSLTCPRICPTSCDNITGKCVSCVGRRIGPKCEDCPPGYYGALCDVRCTAYCKNRSCDQVDGTCHGCVDGYRGDFCHLEVESVYPSIWLLPLIVPFLLLMCCCFVLGGGNLDSEED